MGDGIAGGLYDKDCGDVGCLYIVFSRKGETLSELWRSSDDSRLGLSLSLVKCLYVLTCFLRLEGSVYRLLHPGTLQQYGLSTVCVRVCLKRSLEFE